MTTPPALLSEGYAALVSVLESRVARTRSKAALAVNRKLVLLYWSIGRDLLSRQSTEGWDAAVVDRLAEDLRRRFPEMAGLSAQNLGIMRAFAEAWPDLAFVQQVLALLPWGHNACLLDALSTPHEREWYAHQAIRHGWSRDVLKDQIEGGLHRREGGDAPARAVPAAEVADRIIEDPVSLDMLAPAARHRPR